MKARVVIAGAGPAGVATAARLAQHGRASEVVVFDRYRFPRDKPCGGGLTGHVDRVLEELGLCLDVPHCAATQARVRFAEFERLVTLEKAVKVIRREQLDASLVAQARGLGVEIVEGEGIADFENRGAQLAVRTSAGRELECEILVGADGAASVVRKKLAGKGRRVPHRLFRLEMPVPDGADAIVDEHTMLYDFSLMADGLRGYFWVFPVAGGRCNAGLMHYPDPQHNLGGAQLSALLARAVEELGWRAPTRGVRGWPVWGYHPDTPVAAARVLTVGDAAGVDGLTGEGISVAMEQAIIAGDEIERALAGQEPAFSDYGRKLRRATVGRELALDRRLAAMLYRGDRWREWLSLILFDPDMLRLYAARVDGSEVLADQRWRLVRALARHGLHRRSRKRRLRELVEVRAATRG